MKQVVLFVALIVTGLLGQELLVNGGFEQSLSTGWVTQQGGVGMVTIDRSTGFHPDSDYEARDSLFDGPGWGRLSQTVTVPCAALNLSFTANMQIVGSSPTCWAVAAVCVEYRNSASVVLGETRFYKHDSYCTWTSTPTLHLIDVTSYNWERYTLNIADELSANLPGVNPTQVAKVTVSLYSYTEDG